MNLRERVEHGARGFMELDRASNVQRTVECVLCALEIAKADTDLPERGERDREAMPRAMGLVKRHAAFGHGQRLIVAVLQHQSVRLIPAHRCQDVAGVNHRGEAFGLPEGGHGLLAAASLREDGTRNGMDDREVPAISGCMERGGGLRNVLPDDGRVAHLTIAGGQVEMGEPDAARVMSNLGMLERPPAEGNRSRLIAAGERQPAVETPQRREPRCGDRVAERVGWTAERSGGLFQVVLQQTRFCERRSDGELVLSRQPRGSQRGREHLCGFRTATAFKSGSRAKEKRLDRCWGHRYEYTFWPAAGYCRASAASRSTASPRMRASGTGR